jgi:hypothetical protein
MAASDRGTDCTGVIASDCITATPRVATWICWVQPWRFAWARTVPSGMSILRAISRSPTLAAYPVLICPHVSFVILAERKERTKLGLSKYTAEAAEQTAVHRDKLGIAE